MQDIFFEDTACRGIPPGFDPTGPDERLSRAYGR